MGNSGKPRVRRYFFDTEFNDNVSQFAIDLISIGIVDEDDREYYGISNEFNVAAASSNQWIRENVIDKLDAPSSWVSVDEIRKAVLDMIEPAEEVEFWAKNGSYDNVLLCQLFGGMGKLYEALNQKGVSRVTFRDIKELSRVAPGYYVPPMREADKHIAINDARQEKVKYDSFVAHMNRIPELEERDGPQPGY